MQERKESWTSDISRAFSMQEDCRKKWKPGADLWKEDCSFPQGTDIELKYILLFFPPLFHELA